MGKDLIIVKKLPVITYKAIEKRGKEIKKFINGLNITTIEDTSENLAELKAHRANLNAELKKFESNRLNIKRDIMAPYEAFNVVYVDNISSTFADADIQLKNKIGIIEGRMLSDKILNIQNYFDSVNKLDFVTLASLNVKIINSRSDKAVHNEIDAKLNHITVDVDFIKSLKDADKVLAKYYTNRNIDECVAEVAHENFIAQHIDNKKVKKTKKSNVVFVNVRCKNKRQHKKLVKFLKEEGITYA